MGKNRGASCDHDDDLLTLLIAHFPEISPVVTKQPAKKSGSMEETKIARAPYH